MKVKIAFFLLTVLFVIAGTGVAQDKSAITVKSSELNNGVLIVDVVKGAKEYELQCNQGAPGCTQIKSGTYLMVQLPKNSGMYDCHDVQVFPESATGNDSDKKIGEYCLSEK